MLRTACNTLGVMRPADVPSQIFIRGRLWRVIWRQAGDAQWREQDVDGLTIFEYHEIHLDERLRYDAMRLQEVWIHELLHACFPQDAGRPKGISDAVEERFIGAVALELARALNQTGWSKP